MSLLKQLAGQTVIYGLGHILTRIVYFVLITTYLTYRFEDTFQYAIYVDLYAYASILLVVLSYRMDTAFFRFGSKKENRYNAFNSGLSVLLFTTAVFAVLGFTFARELAVLLKYPDSSHYIRWFTVIISLDTLALLPYAKLRLENKARVFVGFRIFNVLITASLVLFFLEVLPEVRTSSFFAFIPELKYEIDFVFVSNIIASALVLFGLMIKTKGYRFQVDFALWKKMFVYALPLVLVGIAGSFNQFFGVPLQKFFLGEDYYANMSEAGVYGAVQKIASLLALFTTAFNYAAEPFFFSNTELAQRSSLYGKVCRMFVLSGGVIVLGLFLFVDIFQFLIGSNFREGLFVLPILLVAYLFLGIYYNVSIWYKLSDNTSVGAIIALAGAVITLGLSVSFLPRIGYVASAWAALCTYLFMVAAAYLWGQRVYPIEYPVLKILTNLVVIVVIILLSNYIRPILGPSVYIVNALLFAGYLLWCYYSERNEWRQLIARGASRNT